MPFDISIEELRTRIFGVNKRIVVERCEKKDGPSEEEGKEKEKDADSRVAKSTPTE